MYIVAFISIIALLLTFLESKKILESGMRLGIILVTILGCIHYNYGNDYMAYYDIYRSVVAIKFNLSDIIAGEVYKEPGWALLCYFFKPFGGFFVMVAVLNIIQNVIVYKVIRSYVTQKWWPLAVFVYLFSTSFYLLNFSMMRQGLVICIFLGTWSFIQEKKFIKAAIILFLCSTIHQSALILVPFAFWGFIPMNKGKIIVLIYLLLYLFLWVSQTFLNDILAFFFTFEDFEDYAISYGSAVNSNTYRLGFVLNQLPLLLSLLYIASTSNKCDKTYKKFIALSLVSYIITPFIQVIPLIGRVGMYFGIYQIIAIPRVYSNIENKLLRIVFCFIFCLIMIYNYVRFFYSPVFYYSYKEFHTIFSSDILHKYILF